MPVIEHIISLIAPHRCLACNGEGSLLCKKCSSQLPAARERCYRCQMPSGHGVTCLPCSQLTPLQAVASAAAYKDVAKSLIHQLKFERAQAAVKPIALLMTERMSIPKDCIITFIPTANSRVRLRGYDQAERIARAAANSADVPFVPLLARQSNQRQVGASAEQRKHQLAEAFRISSRYIPTNKLVVLIDDVITTGGSLEAAARVLHDAGVARIEAVTFAQA